MELEATERIEKLPIFPLATVLFPGAILPLHIFEERYKMMMRYAIDNGGLFGLSYRRSAKVGAETPPEVGQIGCVAKINAVMPLEEGRMNVLSTGIIRYKVVELLQATPYPLARVETLVDDLEPGADLSNLFVDLTELCKTFLEAAQAVNETNLPVNLELPDDPEDFSLIMASALPIENDAKQTLLELTSTRVRLTRLRHLVTRALTDYNERIKIQEIAKHNGHGKKHLA
jgi:Lon protease-like protein